MVDGVTDGERDETTKGLPKRVMAYARGKADPRGLPPMPGTHGAVKQVLSRFVRSALNGSDPLTGPVAGVSRPEVLGLLAGCSPSALVR